MKLKIIKLPEQSVCHWRRFQAEWDFETACGHYFQTETGNGMADIGFQFCPFCGRQITEQVLGAELEFS
jgi:hypothetical protein